MTPISDLTRETSLGVAVRIRHDVIRAAGEADEALSLLKRLSGWLGRFVQPIRLDAEPDVYAKAHIRDEST
jgi:hypothetical protein